MAQRFLVVMAGGSGTRFWPASRAERPKQFLQLGDSGQTLLQATVHRAAALVGKDHVYVVTNARHGQATRDQLPELGTDNIMLEPAARSTAPCIAWAAGHIRRRSPDAVIGVLPADPHIGDEGAFRDVLDRALTAADGGSVVTIGIEPNRPETGYGYVDEGEAVSDGVHRVRAFVEKPTREMAEAFLKAGHYLWNSGMFFFRADTILREIECHLPQLGEFVAACDDAARRGDEASFVQEAYAGLPRVSIDYGVMEKADDILVVPGRFGWDDIGSWSAAWELARKDDEGNARGGGEQLAVDARGCYTTTRDGKLVALIGVEDLIVVDTGDALLVMPRDRAQDVRAVVDALREGERDEYL